MLCWNRSALNLPFFVVDSTVQYSSSHPRQPATLASSGAPSGRKGREGGHAKKLPPPTHKRWKRRKRKYEKKETKEADASI